MAALAKLENDKTRLRRSVQEGMKLQALAVGLPMAAFAIAAPVVLPLVFGEKWIPALQIFPLIAIGYLGNSIFNLHSSVLYLFGRNLEVAWFHAAHMVLFAGAAFLLVPYLGMMGYGWAEIAALASYIVIHIYLAKEIGSPNYTVALSWFTISIAVLILSTVNEVVRYSSFVLLLLPLLSTKERNSLIGYFQLLRVLARLYPKLTTRLSLSGKNRSFLANTFSMSLILDKIQKLKLPSYKSFSVSLWVS
jgi:PST family polysaccharide transporter